MWEFAVPPHKGDEHYDLGIWHPSALPGNKQNKEGYHELQHRVEEDDCACDVEAENAVQAFEDDVCALVDALPDEEVCSRSWSILIRRNPLFKLISLWPSVATEMAPAIAQSARRHGLVCYDPQNDVVTFPDVRRR